MDLELNRREADLIDTLVTDLLSVSEDPSVTRDALAIRTKLRNKHRKLAEHAAAIRARRRVREAQLVDCGVLKTI